MSLPLKLAVYIFSAGGTLATLVAFLMESFGRRLKFNRKREDSPKFDIAVRTGDRTRDVELAKALSDFLQSRIDQKEKNRD